MSGRKKPLYFQEYKSEFKEYLEKIEYYLVTDLPKIKKGIMWTPVELDQRLHFMKALKKINCLDNDVVFISDADEIPKAEKVIEAAKLIEENDVVIFNQKKYSFYLNVLSENLPSYAGTSACTYQTFKRAFPLVILHSLVLWEKRLFFEEGIYLLNNWIKANRRSESVQIFEKKLKDLKITIIPNAGWHFSWLGGHDSSLYKVQSHTCYGDKTDELGNAYIKHNTCRSNLHNKVFLFRHRLPIMQMGHNNVEKKYSCLEFTKIYHDEDFKIDSELPEYLKINKEKYKHFFKFAKPYDENEIKIQTFGKFYYIRMRLRFLFHENLKKIKIFFSKNSKVKTKNH